MKEIIRDTDDAGTNGTNITSVLNSIVTTINANITNVTEGKHGVLPRDTIFILHSLGLDVLPRSNNNNNNNN